MQGYTGDQGRLVVSTRPHTQPTHLAGDSGCQRGAQEGGSVANLNGRQLLLDGRVLVRVPATTARAAHTY